MGLISGLGRQLRSVIQWDDDGSELFSQWTDNGDEIKNASQLVIKPGQGCIFVYRGKVRSMLHEEGVYNLKTQNIPFITTLQKFMQFFESEHKVGIYYFRKTLILDQKWGTSSAIKYQDPVYDIPVGLKSYGNYSYRLSNPRSFFVNILGSRESQSIAELGQIIGPRLIQPISDYLSEQSYSYADIDANRDEIGSGLKERFNKEFNKLGLKIVDFRIEGTDFDQQTKDRIGRVADITTEALAAKKAGVDFAELQRLQALREAAVNESGAAGAGVGIGAGIGMGQQLAQATMQGTQASETPEKEDIMGAMVKLKQLFEMELISEQEFADKKRELLAKL